MTVDMHRFALMWLVYSRNKFFRVGPNISEKFVPGGTNFRGVQIKRDKPLDDLCTLASLIGATLDRLHFLQGTLKFD